MAQRDKTNFIQKLGPGLLFAGAAIGVSHLVQSTRAGAVYGLALIVFVLIANIAKYPAFRIGNQYAAATGENLLVAYRRQGKGALWLFVLATLGTMFAGCAAVSITAAALAKATFGLPYDTFYIVLAMWALIAGILYFGQYQALDLIVKVLLSFLTVATLISTVMVLPRLSFGGLGDFWPGDLSTPTILFIAALVGWMPAPLDTSVWQSLWSQAKGRVDGRAPSMKDAADDFNVGFVGTTILAVCFLIMGAAIMHGSDLEFDAGAAGFAQQIIDLYRETIGEFAAQLVGAAAMAVVFSTLLTAVDAWPRTLAGVFLSASDEKGEDPRIAHASRQPYYWIGMALLLIGAAIILQMLQNSFRTLIDIATTISFFTAPVFAFLNHRSMFGDHVPAENRPNAGFALFSLAGVIVLAGFALFYLWIRFIG